MPKLCLTFFFERGLDQTDTMNGTLVLAIYLLSDFWDFLPFCSYEYEFLIYQKKIFPYVVKLVHTGKTALEGIFLIFELRKYTFIIMKFCFL